MNWKNRKVSVIKPIIPAEANAGEDFTICKGESITLYGTGGDSYLWSTNKTTQNITVNPERTTTYTLTATRGGVTNSDQVVVTVINCNLNNHSDGIVDSGTGTDSSDETPEDNFQNKEAVNLVIYPNPTKGTLNIQTSVPINRYNLVLMDIHGNWIYSEDLELNSYETEKKLDLSRFAKGVYLIQLYDSDESHVKKVIVI